MKKRYVLLISMLFASGCSSLPKVTSVSGNANSNSYQPAYIVSHGWHTGIVYPREELLRFIPELRERFSDGQYLEIGWGDMEFYQSRDVTAWITLRAILLPTDSVVHVVSVPDSPYDAFPGSNIRRICLGQAQIDSLGTFISNSFQRNQNGRVETTQKGLYGDSQFYVGKGSFNLFNNCNKWTATALESAGYDIDSSSMLTASSVIEFIDSVENPEQDEKCQLQPKQSDEGI